MYKLKVGDRICFSNECLVKEDVKYGINMYDTDRSDFIKHGSIYIDYDFYLQHGAKIIGIKDKGFYYVEYLDEYNNIVCLIFDEKDLKLKKSMEINFDEYKKTNDYI